MGIVASGASVLSSYVVGQVASSNDVRRNQTTTILAASNMLHPPFSSWNNEKKAVGIEIDIVEAAAAKVGKRVKWVERPFAELIDLVASGQVDVAVSTIGITEERKKIVAFSNPYFETKMVALVSPGSPFDSLESLSDAKIGADKATTSYAAAKVRWPNAKLIGAANEGMKWPQMVEQGIIDALVVDGSDQTRLESQSGIQLFQIEEPIKTEWFGIAVNQKAGRLRAAINDEIKQQRSSIGLRIGDEYQFTTPIGRKLNSLAAPSEELIKNYQQARTLYRASPDSPEAIIWYGRRAGYLLRLNEAIQIFSIGIEKHPNDPRLYRHRGHRYISTRQFDKAIADLETAAKLIRGKPNASEPDGAPNAQGIELTTTHGNIWYHLGLAHYLKNDMFNAARCFRECLKIAGNDDGVVSASHWLYMILRRQGQFREAARLVEKIKPEMKIIENKTYHQMCLFYAGQVRENDLMEPLGKAASSDYLRQSVADVLLYGVGNWHQYHRGDKQKCKQLYEQLLAGGSPFSFAFIAAEADYVRMFVGK